mmetsp:Transcript_63268/g.185586  ORF Transcript_63268/g.185586 Transcript_63268/m.185586 type:complete len:272 (+) Transcript_63268:583-1398(+)
MSCFVAEIVVRMRCWLACRVACAASSIFACVCFSGSRRRLSSRELAAAACLSSCRFASARCPDSSPLSWSSCAWRACACPLLAPCSASTLVRSPAAPSSAARSCFLASSSSVSSSASFAAASRHSCSRAARAAAASSSSLCAADSSLVVSWQASSRAPASASTLVASRSRICHLASISESWLWTPRTSESTARFVESSSSTAWRCVHSLARRSASTSAPLRLTSSALRRRAAVPSSVATLLRCVQSRSPCEAWSCAWSPEMVPSSCSLESP